MSEGCVASMHLQLVPGLSYLSTSFCFLRPVRFLESWSLWSGVEFLFVCVFVDSQQVRAVVESNIGFYFQVRVLWIVRTRIERPLRT